MGGAAVDGEGQARQGEVEVEAEEELQLQRVELGGWYSPDLCPASGRVSERRWRGVEGGGFVRPFGSAAISAKYRKKFRAAAQVMAYLQMCWNRNVGLRLRTRK